MFTWLHMMRETTSWLILLEWAIRIGFCLRVIMTRRPVAVSLAWLTLILMIPVLGSIIYLILGELRLGNRRAQWASLMHRQFAPLLESFHRRSYDRWSEQQEDLRGLANLITTATGIPPLPGNEIELLDTPQEIFDAMIADIQSAKETCHLEFYIWEVGGRADELAEAVCQAARRGLTCRLLVDAVGSREFLLTETAQRLRAAGVHLRPALPVGFFRAIFFRFDLRLHRKIAVIDGRIGYTGSQNMADPRLFKRYLGVGPWIDAMVRLRGPAVEALELTFLEDWELESGEGGHLDEAKRKSPQPHMGDKCIQVVPSGPAIRGEQINWIILQSIYLARNELILTTPYYVPDEDLQTAMLSAAARGVSVTLVVPNRVDSRLVRWASYPFFVDLTNGGVRVAQYQGGMLHTKSITIDDRVSLFGSLNLDPRSLNLNFEITLAVFDAQFTTQLRHLQQSYIEQSVILAPESIKPTPFHGRVVENMARLLAPLL